jgi:hypothetical protein
MVQDRRTQEIGTGAFPSLVWKTAQRAYVQRKNLHCGIVELRFDSVVFDPGLPTSLPIKQETQ